MKGKYGRYLIAIFAIALVVFSTGCVRKAKKVENEYKEIKWDYIILKDKLPKPKGTKGRIITNSDDYLTMYVKAESSDPEDDYREYISLLKENGYTLDETNGTRSFEASSSNGYSVKLFLYDSDKEYSISLEQKEEEQKKEEKKEEEKKEEEKKEEAKTDPKEDSKKQQSSGLRKEFKDAMDAYEKYIDEYVAFMKKYKANSSDVTLMTQYAKMMQKYNDAVTSFNKWQSDSSMNSEELKYYVDVQNRVTKKLTEI